MIRRCSYLLLCIIFLLTACGTPAAGSDPEPTVERVVPTEVPTATPPPTRTPIPPTATRTVPPTRAKPSPTATLAPTMRPSPTVAKLEGVVNVRESQGRCEMAMPGGYELDRGGVDTYVSTDRRIFIGLESVSDKAAASLDAADQRAAQHLKTVIGGYQETSRTQAYETRRVNFSGTLGNGRGWGTFYLRQFGRDFCQITIIAAEGTVELLDPILETMVSSLRVLLYTPQQIGYLALGDSYAVGTGASDPATKGYAGLFAGFLRGDKGDRKIEFVNQGVTGATSADFLGDWATAGRAGGSPLANAVRALGAGNINIVTIDIGGNDILHLLKPGEACEGKKIESADCFTAMRAALREMTTPNLTQIIATLVDAAPAGTQIIVLTYPNPFSIGKATIAEERTDAAMQELNILITNAVRANEGAATRRDVMLSLADVAKTFDNQGAKLTHIADPTPDIHPNDAGYAAIVAALKKEYRQR